MKSLGESCIQYIHFKPLYVCFQEKLRFKKMLETSLCLDSSRGFKLYIHLAGITILVTLVRKIKLLPVKLVEKNSKC